MEKHMGELEVRTTPDGKIEVFWGTNKGSGDYGVISVAREQVDVLVKWLQEAKSELEIKSSNNRHAASSLSS